MTFDYSPDWMDRLSEVAEYSSAAPRPVAASPRPPSSPSTLAQPTTVEIAALVEELFAEGSLSYEQLRSLSAVPELSSLLGDALENVPASRRIRGRR